MRRLPTLLTISQRSSRPRGDRPSRSHPDPLSAYIVTDGAERWTVRALPRVVRCIPVLARLGDSLSTPASPRLPETDLVSHPRSPTPEWQVEAPRSAQRTAVAAARRTREALTSYRC